MFRNYRIINFATFVSFKPGMAPKAGAQKFMTLRDTRRQRKIGWRAQSPSF